MTATETTTRAFDPWQQEAIDIACGRHLVLAPPGCGKTDILSERVAHARVSGVPYAEMLCLTFTNRAAKGMAQRMAERTGNPVPDDLFVGNIHRYCSQMLFAEGVVNHRCAIIDEGDVESIVQEELCRKMSITSHTTELVRYQHALWQLKLGQRGDVVLHSDMLHTGAMAKLCDVLQRGRTEQDLAEIYTDIRNLASRHPSLAELPAANTMLLADAYERYKADNDLLDYDDLLILAYHHLCSSTGAEARRYSWIEIDEVQDLNPLQLALVDRLASDDATIVYLGDEQQAIFSFIGAKMETLQNLKQRCAGNIHYLHNNYRSPRYLLDLQNDYAVRNLGLPAEMLPSTGNETPASEADLCLLDVGDATLEPYYAARFASRYGEIDPIGRVAILVSTNREADEVSQAMETAGVRHFKISGTDLFAQHAVRLVLAHLTVLADETVFIAWARLMWGLRAVPTYTAARALMRDMRAIGLLPSDFLATDGESYVSRFVQAYDTEDLVIFDTETTGLDTSADDIVQIAAIRVRKGQIVGQPFQVMLRTERDLPPTVGGHPNPMLQLYRTSRLHDRAKGLRSFIQFCQGSVLVGHNAAFDYAILDANLRRECPDLRLADICPHWLDTLKYIRLVRPRLRQYKLAHLLQVLHLEGANSHRADDDILATLSLLRFCHLCGQQLVGRQRSFIEQHAAEIERFRDNYSDIYHDAASSTSMADEMRRVYSLFCNRGLTTPVDKWHHLMHYVEADMVRPDLYPTLRSQLERYITDLCTSKEADICGGSLQERFVISTVHKAKGLEFDTVIVYRAIDGAYPAQRSWTEKQISEDARRLFVALSRSRRRLMVICDSHYGRTPHALSPFLDKVRHHFTLYHRTPDGKIRRG